MFCFVWIVSSHSLSVYFSRICLWNIHFFYSSTSSHTPKGNMKKKWSFFSYRASPITNFQHFYWLNSDQLQILFSEWMGHNVVLSWSLSTHKTCSVHPRDGSAWTHVHATTLRWKLHIKLAASSSSCILTPGRPTLALTIIGPST